MEPGPNELMDRNTPWFSFAADVTPMPLMNNRELRVIPRLDWLAPMNEKDMLINAVKWLQKTLIESNPFTHLKINPMSDYTRMSDVFSKILSHYQWREVVERLPIDTKPSHFKELFDRFEDFEHKLTPEQFESMAWFLGRRLMLSWECHVVNQGSKLEPGELTWVQLLEPYGVPKIVKTSTDRGEPVRKRLSVRDRNFIYPYKGTELGVVRSAIVIMLSTNPDCFASELNLQSDQYAWLSTGSTAELTDFYLTPVLLRQIIYPVYQLNFLPLDYILRSCQMPPYVGFTDDTCWDLVGIHLWWVYNYIKDARLLAREAVNNSMDLVRHTRDSDTLHLELWSAMHSMNVSPVSKLHLKAHSLLIPRLPEMVRKAIWKREGNLILIQDYTNQNEGLLMHMFQFDRLKREDFLKILESHEMHWNQGHTQAAKSQMLWDTMRIGLKVWHDRDEGPISSLEMERLEKTSFHFGKRFHAALKANLDPHTVCPCVGWETCDQPEIFFQILQAAKTLDRRPVWDLLEGLDDVSKSKIRVDFKPSAIKAAAEEFAVTTAAVNMCLSFIAKSAMCVHLQRSNNFNWRDLRVSETTAANPILSVLQSALNTIDVMNINVGLGEDEEDEDEDDDVTDIEEGTNTTEPLTVTVEPTGRTVLPTRGVVYLDSDSDD
ncbi:hypothetical protein [Crucian carp herpesvirus]|nr:hypothetical protein [Crucian carp herpesvirus]